MHRVLDILFQEDEITRLRGRTVKDFVRRRRWIRTRVPMINAQVLAGQMEGGSPLRQGSGAEFGLVSGSSPIRLQEALSFPHSNTLVRLQPHDQLYKLLNRFTVARLTNALCSFSHLCEDAPLHSHEKCQSCRRYIPLARIVAHTVFSCSWRMH